MILEQLILAAPETATARGWLQFELFALLAPKRRLFLVRAPFENRAH